MCLGDVGQVVSVSAQRAEVRIGVRTIPISLMALDVGLADTSDSTFDHPVRMGDWLLVHSGFALSRVTPEEAADALTLRASVLPAVDHAVVPAQEGFR